MRSTGLGKTELIGEIADLTQGGDYLILHVRTTEPVLWHVRTALSFADLIRIIRLILKPSNLVFLLLGFIKHRNPKPPPEY